MQDQIAKAKESSITAKPCKLQGCNAPIKGLLPMYDALAVNALIV